MGNFVPYKLILQELIQDFDIYIYIIIIFFFFFFGGGTKEYVRSAHNDCAVHRWDPGH